ncbi:23S rRNA (uracil(1939)-C(5))-methyltransferase RlmD [[Clostridium] innocuum]|uniref:23S rRNA (uracil(1939)-C(5))-methyltransferase RlmD n=1 Tax=Clostridium innocuum TaxID=1522 RepID=UPI001E638213|nr:23S rRNA (uracil(1939)-C(5))-methyltransferase RlmD [[Clostridium] innocuum]MCC2831254.1 23S rRNA (uracil(1939)-C(5))-methyltransferase RlmD [[Clostridium] innocuum]
MKKNDQVHGVCSGYTHDGHGVVKVNGFPLFVKGMLEGEEGDLVVTMAKKTFGYGRLLKRSVTSPQRVTPPCPIAKQCGGCQLQHMSYSEQLRFKKQKVQDVIQRIAHLDVEVQDVLGMQEYTHYRNKGQIPVGMDKGKTVTGFYRINSNSIIDTDTCLIQSERINEVLQEMRRLLQTYNNARVFRHLLIKHAFSSDEVMVVWIVRSFQIPHEKEMVRELSEALPFVKSIIVNLNQRTDNVILGDKEKLLYGERVIVDSIHDLKFSISSKSFYQVNPKQTEVLYGKALEFAQLTGKETVLDLYCGVGTISMFLAQQARHVTGIEIVPQAIQDARKNAALNGIANIEFVCSDAASYAKKLCEQGMHPDVIVVDPPRKGCDAEAIESMVMMQPKRIVYVSCDPGTLARDLKLLKEKGYHTEIVQPVEMFPFTHHVETVVLLSHKKADSYIHIDVEFGEGEGKIPVDSIAKRAEAYKPKEKVTYKMIKEYIEAKYGFKVHTAYIAEVKRNLGLPMYDAPNAVEELKQPRKHPTPEKVEAIKDALRYFAVI